MKLSHLLAATAMLSSAAVAEKYENQNKGDPDRVICRTQEVTGSRLKREKLCLTASQWAEQKANNREVIEKAQSRKWSQE